jgi:hypothetical protein
LEAYRSWKYKPCTTQWYLVAYTTCFSIKRTSRFTYRVHLCVSYDRHIYVFHIFTTFVCFIWSHVFRMITTFMCFIWSPHLCVSYDHIFVFHVFTTFMCFIWSPHLCVSYDHHIYVFHMITTFMWFMWSPHSCVSYDHHICVFHMITTINRAFFHNSVKQMVFVMAAWNVPYGVDSQF